MQAAMASAERIFALLDGARHPHARDAGRAARGGGDGASFARRVVRVRRRALGAADCSFDVAPGEHVAIVGAPARARARARGCSTAPTTSSAASVRVGGVDVREWDLERLRRHVGIIFQDTVLFTGSVEANLSRASTAT
jgi:ATP-binding cassette subfamily B protein